MLLLLTERLHPFLKCLDGSLLRLELGELPAVFRDIATLNDYRTLHLDAFGMAAEVKVLERHLLERGIVCIVDTTNFHPELGAVVAEDVTPFRLHVLAEGVNCGRNIALRKRFVQQAPVDGCNDIVLDRSRQLEIGQTVSGCVVENVPPRTLRGEHARLQVAAIDKTQTSSRPCFID